MLTLDLLPEVDVLALEPRLECGDLLVRLHVLDGDGDLVGHVLQERGVGVRVLVLLYAGHGEDADRRAPGNQRDDHVGPDTVFKRAVLHGVLALDREVAPEEVPLAPQDPADVALAGGHLQTDREVRRGQGRLQDEEPEDVPLRTVQEDRGPLEGDHPPEGLGDGMKERIAREVRDDGVGDLEQRAVARRRPYGRFGPRGSVH